MEVIEDAQEAIMGSSMVRLDRVSTIHNTGNSDAAKEAKI